MWARIGIVTEVFVEGTRIGNPREGTPSLQEKVSGEERVSRCGKARADPHTEVKAAAKGHEPACEERNDSKPLIAEVTVG